MYKLDNWSGAERVYPVDAIEKRCQLLSVNEYNISEIGDMVGFGSHSYFSKCFFQQFKLTPPEFAENYKSQMAETVKPE